MGVWIIYEAHASRYGEWLAFRGRPEDFDSWYPSECLWLVPGTIDPTL